MTTQIRWLITGLVSAISTLSIVLVIGCGTGMLEGDSCRNQPTESFAILGGLLTTIIGLSVKVEALEPPKPRTVRPKPTSED